MNVLSLSNVTAAYGRTPIIRDVTLEVEEGEIAALIGRNGVGKTTLMKTAIGLLPATEGTISFKDRNVTDLPANDRARRGIGYVPQKRNVFPDMTVEENLRVGTLIGSESDDVYFDEVYEYFPRLDERRNQRAGSMSGGEQQMLALGRALVGGPDILLLDEPSEGVQPSIVDEISENIRAINEQMDTTVLFVEQNLEFTTNTADRCYVMVKGTIVDELAPQNLRESEAVREYMTV
ncbi:ATP-binding cassette domain-containing protein [Halobellus sp. GM3]|uniref:ATP-binding cassette domain-containing protein n=1 Tax=Halobellus sp. GM3 TaxID=3458410 RepID=UPI00403DD65C